MPTAEDALTKMQEVLQDPSIGWTCVEQREAMMAVLQRETDVVAILPTGGGKSMLAIVPSLLETHMATVLVVPLNSLIMDYERRLRMMRVPYQVYILGQDLNCKDNLVLVSADKSQMGHWRDALGDLGRRKTIARIVVDEAHIPLITTSYRRSLEHFDKIRSKAAPLVLLSATLPPTFMPQVRKTYQLVSTTRVCRQSTDRKELAYVLEKRNLDKTGLVTRVMEIVGDQEQTWSMEDRVLVFVPSIALCVRLAQQGGWHRYVGAENVMTDEEQRTEYMAWRDGHGSKVMVATSAFSTGNDYAHIRLVMHVDKPFDMVEYIQGQGRAGRDGAAATCHTLVPIKKWKRSDKENEIEKENEQGILDHLYLYGLKRCLRYGATLFTDGIGVGCHEREDKEKCSVCREDPQHRPEEIQMATLPRRGITTMGRDGPQTFAEAMNRAKNLQATREIGQLKIAEKMKKALQSMQGRCSVCLIHRPQEREKHLLKECPSLRGQLGVSWSEYIDWRRKLRYQKHHQKICFVCHVPQITDELHPTMTKAKMDGVGCEYADIIAPMVFGMYHEGGVKRKAEECFREKWESENGFAGWLMGKPKGKSYSNMVDLFMWYMEETKE